MRDPNDIYALHNFPPQLPSKRVRASFARLFTLPDGTEFLLSPGDTVVAEIVMVRDLGFLIEWAGVNTEWSCIVSLEQGVFCWCRVPCPSRKARFLVGRRIKGKVKDTPFDPYPTIIFENFHDEDPPPSTATLTTLNEFDAEIDAVQSPIVQELQAFLKTLEGRTFIEEGKQHVAARIQDILNRLGQRIVCPKTGLPGFLRVSKVGKSGIETFQIQITENGKRTCRFSSVKFPSIQLCPAPEDARRKEE